MMIMLQYSMLLFGHIEFLTFDISILCQIYLEWIYVVFETERGDRPQDVVPIDSLSLLALAFIGRFARDEADELRYAFLNGFFRVFRDFPVARDDLFHDSPDVRYREESILFFISSSTVVVDVNIGWIWI